MSKSVEALENLLSEARSKMTDIDRAIEANQMNLATCEKNKSELKADIDDLQTSVNVLNGMKQGPFDPTRKNVK